MLFLILRIQWTYFFNPFTFRKILQILRLHPTILCIYAIPIFIKYGISGSACGNRPFFGTGKDLISFCVSSFPYFSYTVQFFRLRKGCIAFPHQSVQDCLGGCLYHLIFMGCEKSHIITVINKCDLMQEIQYTCRLTSVQVQKPG